MTKRSTAIHTPHELARKGRHLDRINSGVNRVIAVMQRGATLHRTQPAELNTLDALKRHDREQ